jgi:hypothetical protein
LAATTVRASSSRRSGVCSDRDSPLGHLRQYHNQLRVNDHTLSAQNKDQKIMARMQKASVRMRLMVLKTQKAITIGLMATPHALIGK